MMKNVVQKIQKIPFLFMLVLVFFTCISASAQIQIKAKENRTKYLFFPPRRKFLSTVREVSFHRDGKKKAPRWKE